MNPVEKKWRKKGYSFDIWADPPGQRWEDFVHEVDELVYVKDGVMEFEIDSKVYHLEPGEELLIPAGAHHSARNIGTTAAHWYYGYKRGS